VNYGGSVVVAKPVEGVDQVESDQSLATEVLIGKRMPSVKVLNQSDARPWNLQEVLPSNGRWRVIVFAGDIKDPAQKAKIQQLADAIDRPESFLHMHTPKGARYDEVFEILTVHSSPRQDVTIFDFPAVFRPYDEVEGWDYNKIYVDDMSYH
jgi:phenol 2-monooxygenase